MHVHYHIIPKPSKEAGLGIVWPATDPDKDALVKLASDIKAKM
jgi:diadenosine tetraphosphate (Ap4A) HIT family hydrolase